MINKRILGFVALGLLFCYLLVLQSVAIWPFTIDDMYISLRYAKNWADGNGLLWNIGEPPVEGYSNFLFVCFAAAALKFGFNPVVLLKLIGVAGLGFASIALYGLSRFWFSPRLSLIPVLWLLFDRHEIIWVSSGLETTSYQALLLSSAYVLLRGLGYKAMPIARGSMRFTYWFFAGLLLALAGLTRPEGGVVGAIFFLIAYCNLPNRRKSLPGFALGLTVFALLYGIYFIWRWHYFGLLLPNSVYCKGFAKSHWLVLDKSYLTFAWPFLLLGLVGIFSNKTKTAGHDRRLYFLWIPSVVYLIFLAQADPVSAMSQRLFLPAFALLLPLSLLGIQHIINYFMHKQESLSALVVGVSALWIGMFFLTISSLEQLVFFTHNPLSGEKLRLELTEWLKPQVSSEKSIVMGDSGLLPYFIPARFEDSYCLNNKKMAKASYATMFDAVCKRILQQKPEVIIVASLVEEGKTIYMPADKCLHDKLKRNTHYRKAKLFQTGVTQSNYRYQIYIKQ